VKKIHFKFPDGRTIENPRIHIQGVASSATWHYLCATKHGTVSYISSCASYTPGMHNCTFLRVKITICLFSKMDQWKKPSFLPLNPKNTYSINRDPFTHSYSFRKLRVQDKGQTSKFKAKDLHPPLVLSRVSFLYCFVFMFVVM